MNNPCHVGYFMYYSLFIIVSYQHVAFQMQKRTFLYIQVENSVHPDQIISSEAS